LEVDLRNLVSPGGANYTQRGVRFKKSYFDKSSLSKLTPKGENPSGFSSSTELLPAGNDFPLEVDLRNLEGLSFLSLYVYFFIATPKGVSTLTRVSLQELFFFYEITYLFLPPFY